MFSVEGQHPSYLNVFSTTQYSYWKQQHYLVRCWLLNGLIVTELGSYPKPGISHVWKKNVIFIKKHLSKFVFHAFFSLRVSKDTFQRIKTGLKMRLNYCVPAQGPKGEGIDMTVISQASWLPVKEKHGGGAEGSGPKSLGKRRVQ